jgi:putative ABC transport system permease protein
MKLNEIFTFSFGALRDRKVRSILTILMVVVGSALMVSVSGLTAGTAAFMEKQFDKLARNVITLSNSVVIRGGAQASSSSSSSSGSGLTLDSTVVNTVRSLPFVEDVITVNQGPVTLETRGKSTNTIVFSMDPQKLYSIAPTLELTDGSSIKANDPSAIIVADSIANPSGQSTPFLSIGQAVRLTYTYEDRNTGEEKEESKSFIVSGIMKETGNMMIDRSLIINQVAGNSLFHESNKYSSIMLVVESADYVSTVEQEIKDIYGDKIGIMTSEALLQTTQEISSEFGSFILAIATVALLVGAVGIITTLYTSVQERVREIGTVKAIGAQNREILFLFLNEASTIGIIGATVGLMVGIVGGYILTSGYMPGRLIEGDTITPVFLPNDLAFVWIISVALSLLAGVYPAWKASKLEPIVALRRE